RRRRLGGGRVRRQRAGHRRRDVAAALRTLLHYEGRRRRPRPGDRAPHRRGARRQHHRRQSAAGWRLLHGAVAGAKRGGMRGAVVLVVDDDDRLRDTLGILLTSGGHEPVLVPDVAAARRVLEERDVELVISDLRMPGGSGLDVLDAAQRLRPHAPVILLTAFGTIDTAVLAMQRGAADYVLKPFDAGELEVRIARALAQRRSQRENEYWRDESAANHGVDGLIGVSPALQRVLGLVRQVAPRTPSA